MPEILSLFHGDVIVVVGKVAGRYFQQIKEIAKLHNAGARVIMISHSGRQGISDEERIREIDDQFAGDER
jgi:3-phosphoglycerate kinase